VPGEAGRRPFNGTAGRQCRSAGGKTCGRVRSSVDLDQQIGTWADDHEIPLDQPQKEFQMRKSFGFPRSAMLAAAVVLVTLASATTPSRAETGTIRVEFTKAGFIVGVGGGRGVLTFRGRNYPFTVSGMSLGATIGASTNRLTGRALGLRSPGDLAGTYTAIGAGAAVAAGAGGGQLQNTRNGVILQLSGAKVGVELSAALSGVQIAMQ
jgi:hypothetical protein